MIKKLICCPVVLLLLFQSCNQSDKPKQTGDDIQMQESPQANDNNTATNDETARKKIEPTNETTTGQLYLGEYACYGYGNRIMTGMGFVLSQNGSYTDIDKGRGGNYIYDAESATIKFNGGFLDGQTGTEVTAKGFPLSETVFAEPWK